MQKETTDTTANNAVYPILNENNDLINPFTGEVVSEVNGCSPEFLNNLLETKIAIGVLKKNMANAAQGYRFTALNYIAQKIYPILKEYNIDLKLDFSKPYQVEYTREIRDKKDKYNPSTWVSIKSLVVDVKVTVYNTANALTDYYVFSFPMPIDLQQANLTQGMGSSLTYARRYALSLLFGITYDDKEDIDYNSNEEDADVNGKSNVMPSSKASVAGQSGANGKSTQPAQSKSVDKSVAKNETAKSTGSNTNGGQAGTVQSVKTEQDVKVEKQSILADNKVLTLEEYNQFKKFCVEMTSEDSFMSAIKSVGVNNRREVTYKIKDQILDKLNIYDKYVENQEGGL